MTSYYRKNRYSRQNSYYGQTSLNQNVLIDSPHIEEQERQEERDLETRLRRGIIKLNIITEMMLETKREIHDMASNKLDIGDFEYYITLKARMELLRQLSNQEQQFLIFTYNFAPPNVKKNYLRNRGLPVDPEERNIVGKQLQNQIESELQNKIDEIVNQMQQEREEKELTEKLQKKDEEKRQQRREKTRQDVENTYNFGEIPALSEEQENAEAIPRSMDEEQWDNLQSTLEEQCNKRIQRDSRYYWIPVNYETTMNGKCERI